MKILGLFILLLGAVFSFGASKWITLVTKEETPPEREILITKLLGLAIAVVGMLFVFYA